VSSPKWPSSRTLANSPASTSAVSTMRTPTYVIGVPLALGLDRAAAASWER